MQTMINNRRSAPSSGTNGGFTKANPKSAPVASPYNGGSRKTLSGMKGHKQDEGNPDLLKWFFITFLGTLALLSFGGSSAPKDAAGVATAGETTVNLRGTEPPVVPMVPETKPEPVKHLTEADWAGSQAKLLLQRDIERSEEKRNLKPILLQNTRKEYREFGLEVFRQHMEEEVAAFNKLNVPAADADPPSEPDPPAAPKLTEADWAGSRAEKLLKRDVDTFEEKRHLKPILLQKTRKEYEEFAFEVFRSHFQEEVEEYYEAHKPTEPPTPKLKEEDWANSKAQELLKHDVENFEEKRTEKPTLLQQTRKEYRAFAFGVFRQHFHEEVEAYHKANPDTAGEVSKMAKDETPTWQYLVKRDIVDPKKNKLQVTALHESRQDYESVDLPEFKDFVVKTRQANKGWLALLEEDLKDPDNILMKPVKLQQTKKEYQEVEFEVFRTALTAEKESLGMATSDNNPLWWAILKNDLKDPKKLAMNPKQLKETRPKYQALDLAEFRDAFFAEKLALLNQNDKGKDAEKDPQEVAENAAGDPSAEKNAPQWMKLLKQDLKDDVKSQMKPVKLQQTRDEYKEVKFEEFRTTLAAQKLAVNEAAVATPTKKAVDPEDDESVPHWLMTLRKDLTDPEKRTIKPKELKKTRDIYDEVDLELFRHCVWALKEKVH